MTITRLHMSVTILIALVMHVGIAMWFVPSTPPPLAQPLRINLLAVVAKTTVNASVAVAEPPPKPKPMIQEVLPELQSDVKSPPKALQKIVQPSPPEPSTAPLDAVATVRYEQLLVAWLEKHKKYPRRAKRLRIEGEGMLRILIDRTGRTRHVTLQQRTGNRLLDKAALEMAQRADPFPPMPENDPRRQLEFSVPVAFVLR